MHSFSSSQNAQLAWENWAHIGTVAAWPGVELQSTDPIHSPCSSICANSSRRPAGVRGACHLTANIICNSSIILPARRPCSRLRSARENIWPVQKNTSTDADIRPLVIILTSYSNAVAYEHDLVHKSPQGVKSQETVRKLGCTFIVLVRCVETLLLQVACSARKQL